MKLEDGRLWVHHTNLLKLQEENHSREPKGRLPSDGEVYYDPDIPLSLEEHSSTPIMASQSPITFITPMDDFQMVSDSGESLANGSATSSIPDRRYPLRERHPPD